MSTTRTSQKTLDAIAARINRMTGSPLEAYTRTLDAPNSGPAKENDKYPYSLRANVGHYHIDQAYGGVALHRMANESGGVSDVLRVGHVPKRELERLMHAFIEGLEAA